jgi:hypothetical protein
LSGFDYSNTFKWVTETTREESDDEFRLNMQALAAQLTERANRKDEEDN